ncbi:MAG TPA: methylmalonyl Co-A mutase-associated GTPase MeaB, partial [Hanamia sp.]|nr:methylmalonyl Co-A mutase-associated GTPase MeaB [Hanamia sp.]
HPRIFEIADFVKSHGFDYVIIETVGVGQSEVDIVAIADITFVMLVPEGGDVIQTMKAGVMEVADIFVINKSDRPGAENFYKFLVQMLGGTFKKEIPIVKTIATEKSGIDKLYQTIKSFQVSEFSDYKLNLLTEKIWALIRDEKMKNFDKEDLKKEIGKTFTDKGFNLYSFAKKYQKSKE